MYCFLTFLIILLVLTQNIFAQKKIKKKQKDILIVYPYLNYDMLLLSNIEIFNLPFITNFKRLSKPSTLWQVIGNNILKKQYDD